MLARCKILRHLDPMLRVVILLTVLMVASGARAETFSNADLLRNFNIVAFGNEYSGRRFDVVRKWREPIRIGIDGSNHPPYLETYLDDMAQQLSAATGHPIELYYAIGLQRENKLPPDFDSKKVNVFVLYLSDEEVRKAVYKYFGGSDVEKEALLAEATCMANYRTRQNEIRSAVIIFPERHPESYHRACVVEELTQILGLPNDSNLVSPSIFNDSSREFDLTDHDIWLLRALYQKEIQPGTSRNDALRLALDFWKRARPE